jgi:hypothetical protein
MAIANNAENKSIADNFLQDIQQQPTKTQE